MGTSFETICSSPVPGQTIHYGLLLTSSFLHFGVPVHLVYVNISSFIDVGTVKLMCLLPSKHANSSSTPSSSSIPPSSSSSLPPSSSVPGFLFGLGPSFGPFSFSNDDPLDTPISPCDLLPHQATIDHLTTTINPLQMRLIWCRVRLIIFSVFFNSLVALRYLIFLPSSPRLF